MKKKFWEKSEILINFVFINIFLFYESTNERPNESIFFIIK